MIRRREFVFLYAPPWNGAARFSKHHLAAHLAQAGHRVLYVEAPLGPLSLLKRPTTAWSEFAGTLHPPRREGGLAVRRYFNPIPYHDAFPVTRVRGANILGQRLGAGVLRRDLARLGFARPTLIAGLPHAVDMLSNLPHRGLIYHCADDYVHVHGFPRGLPELEADLCRQADLVITTSSTLRDSRLPLNSHTYWVPNGVELDHFSRRPPPAPDLSRLPRPVIGFVGNLAQWVDIPLIRSVALQRPEWQIVLVGPVSVDIQGVEGLPNVHLLGARPYEDIPAYLAAMDVALIPFVQDQVTFNADPIKAYEYLAAGVPVVATDLPALRRLASVIRLADSAEDFVDQIGGALADGRERGAQTRRDEAGRNTWASRFEQFDALVESCVPF